MKELQDAVVTAWRVKRMMDFVIAIQTKSTTVETKDSLIAALKSLPQLVVAEQYKPKVKKKVKKVKPKKRANLGRTRVVA